MNSNPVLSFENLCNFRILKSCRRTFSEDDQYGVLGFDGLYVADFLEKLAAACGLIPCGVETIDVIAAISRATLVPAYDNLANVERVVLQSFNDRNLSFAHSKMKSMILLFAPGILDSR